MLDKLYNYKLERRLIDKLDQELVRQLWPEISGQFWDQLEHQFDKIHVRLWFELKRQLDTQLNTELECSTN